MNQYSIEKVANAIIYFLDNGVEYFGKTKLMKLMFFADKYHLQKYMRTVFADNPFGSHIRKIFLQRIGGVKSIGLFKLFPQGTYPG